MKTLNKIKLFLTLIIIGFYCFNLSAQAPCLQSAVNYPGGMSVMSIASGDFNGDNVLDLVVANMGEDTNNISVFIGNGDGSFADAEYYNTDTAFAVMVNDYNNDSIIDIAVNTGTGISVLLGIGNGAFGVPVVNITLADVSAMGHGYFNNDSILDIVTGRWTGGIEVLMGVGNGSFAAPVLDFIGASTVSEIKISDFDNDSIEDILLFDGVGLLIAFGDGNGAFVWDSSYISSISYNAIVASDLNGDSVIDIIGAKAAGDISVFMGIGNGVFDTPVNYVAGDVTGITVDDITGNAILDLIIFHDANNEAAVLVGNGDGSFQSMTTYPVGQSPSDIITGDWNSDGLIDVATSNNNSMDISILLHGVTTSISGTSITCSGNGATLLASGDSSIYSYLWSTGDTSSLITVNPLVTSSYSVTITNVCSDTASDQFMVNVSDVPAVSSSSTPVSCNGVNSGTVDITVSGGLPPYTFFWSPGGETSEDLSNLSPGIYTVSILDSNGCAATDSALVDNLAPFQSICMVTVDTASAKNLVVWEKPLVTNIDSFKIYRLIASVYVPIGVQPYSDLSEYVDSSFGIDPKITSYRYRISVIDSCGGESPLSDYHETIHLTASKGIGSEINLVWDAYEGFTVSQYRILRKTQSMTSYQVIDSVPTFNFTYTDQLVPAANTISYIIEVVPPVVCISAKAGSYSSLVSNAISLNITGLENFKNRDVVNMYPNPFLNSTTVWMNTGNFINAYRIYDLGGNLVRTEDDLNEKILVIDRGALPRGMYFLMLSSEKAVLGRKKIVIQ